MYLLAVAEHTMRAKLDYDLRPLHLTITGYSILRLLAEDPGISASELARRTLISQQAASRLVLRLLRLGLVERFEEQGRTQRLRNSATGTTRLLHADQIVGAWELRVRNALPQMQADVFMRQLETFTGVFAGPTLRPTSR